MVGEEVAGGSKGVLVGENGGAGRQEALGLIRGRLGFVLFGSRR